MERSGLQSRTATCCRRVPPERDEAFNSWYGKRKSDGRANPPGYRKKNYDDNQGRLQRLEHPEDRSRHVCAVDDRVATAVFLANGRLVLDHLTRNV
jgi:hypothetical protein